MNEWTYMPRTYCPSCGAFALWGNDAHIAYCVRCEVRLTLEVIHKIAMGAQELEELAQARYLAGVDGNSAVGAFG